MKKITEIEEGVGERQSVLADAMSEPRSEKRYKLQN